MCVCNMCACTLMCVCVICACTLMCVCVCVHVLLCVYMCKSIWMYEEFVLMCGKNVFESMIGTHLRPGHSEFHFVRSEII